MAAMDESEYLQVDIDSVDLNDPDVVAKLNFNVETLLMRCPYELARQGRRHPIKENTPVINMIKNSKTIKHMHLVGDIFRDDECLGDILRSNPMIATLEMYHRSINIDRLVMLLAESFLTHLRLNNAKFFDSHPLAHLIRQSKTLQHLYVYMQRKFMLCENIESITDALAGNINLIYFHFSYTGPIDLGLFANVLDCNSTLTRLDLDSVDFQGVEQFATALTTNKTLRYLRLVANENGSDMSPIITAAFRGNSLIKLKLVQCGIKTINCPEDVTHNMTLRKLELSSNQIECVRDFMMALRQNAGLRTVRLGANPFGYIKCIDEMLDHNTTITDMGYLGGCVINNESVDIIHSIEEKLERNRTQLELEISE